MAGVFRRTSPPALHDATDKLVGKRGKSAAKVSQPLLAARTAASSTQAQFAPEPSRRHVVGIRAELVSQEWLPDDAKGRISAELAEPFGGAEMVDLPPVADAARAQER